MHHDWKLLHVTSSSVDNKALGSYHGVYHEHRDPTDGSLSSCYVLQLVQSNFSPIRANNGHSFIDSVVKLGHIRFKLCVRKVANPVTNCFMFHFRLALIGNYTDNTHVSSFQFVTSRKLDFFVNVFLHMSCSKFSRCLQSRWLKTYYLYSLHYFPLLSWIMINVDYADTPSNVTN